MKKKILLFALFISGLEASTGHSTPARPKKDRFEHYPPKEHPQEYPYKWQVRPNEYRKVDKVILMPDPDKYWESRIKGETEIINRLFKFHTVSVKHHPTMVSKTKTQYHFLF